MSSRVQLVSRRQLIRMVGGAATLLASTPGCTSSGSALGLFSSDQRSALTAFADVIIPPDDEPGGAALGAVDYIERLLTAFDDKDIPAIFAGGPFSGRQPFPDATGHASTNFPPSDFADLIELDRVSEASWRLRIFGSAGLPAGSPNQKLTGAIASLRDQVRGGLDAAIASADPPLAQQSAADREGTFNAQPAAWKSLMIELVTEAAFAAPEYGGNVGLAGWKMCHFEGDSQPLGYSQWDGNKNVERPESPLSTPNPGPDAAPISREVDQLLKLVIAFIGGRTA